MEYCGKRRQPVGSRHGHLAHDVYLYAANLPQRDAHLRLGGGPRDARILAREYLAYLLIGLGYGQPVEVDGANLAHHDVAFGGYLLADGSLVGAPDVDNHLVARPQAVVLGGGHVLVGLEGEGAATEHVAAKDQARGRAVALLRRVARHVGGHVYRARRPLGERTLHRSACPAFRRKRGVGHAGLAALTLFILLPDAFGLFARHAACHQLPAYLTFSLTGSHAGFHIIDYLLVAHLRMDRHRRAAQQQCEQKNSSRFYHQIFC